MHEPWLLSLLFATSLVAGFVDSIAGGGGLITLPVLLSCGLDPRLALGPNGFAFPKEGDAKLHVTLKGRAKRRSTT